MKFAKHGENTFSCVASGLRTRQRLVEVWMAGQIFPLVAACAIVRPSSSPWSLPLFALRGSLLAPSRSQERCYRCSQPSVPTVRTDNVLQPSLEFFYGYIAYYLLGCGATPDSCSLLGATVMQPMGFYGRPIICVRQLFETNQIGARGLVFGQ